MFENFMDCFHIDFHMRQKTIISFLNIEQAKTIPKI